jgi:hypothetical protein
MGIDAAKTGLPLTEPQRNESELEKRGRELVRNIRESSFEGWQKVKHGAEVFFGATTDGQTGYSTGSTETYLQATLNGTENLGTIPENWQEMVKVAGELKTEMTGLLDDVRTVAEVDMVDGPADRFGDEIVAKYEEMVREMDVERKKQLIGEISQRIAEEKTELGNAVAKVSGDVEGLGKVSTEKDNKFEEWRKGYYNVSNGEHSETINSFGNSLRGLKEKVEADARKSEPDCRQAGEIADKLGDGWDRFVGDFLMFGSCKA